MQTKPKAKSVDALSDKRWQNTWVWQYAPNFTLKKPERIIKDRTATILTYLFIAIMWLIAIGIVWEVYKAVDCKDWQNRPLDQVSRCVKEAK